MRGPPADERTRPPPGPGTASDARLSGRQAAAGVGSWRGKRVSPRPVSRRGDDGCDRGRGQEGVRMLLQFGVRVFVDVNELHGVANDAGLRTHHHIGSVAARRLAIEPFKLFGQQL